MVLTESACPARSPPARSGAATAPRSKVAPRDYYFRSPPTFGGAEALPSAPAEFFPRARVVLPAEFFPRARVVLPASGSRGDGTIAESSRASRRSRGRQFIGRWQ